MQRVGSGQMDMPRLNSKVLLPCGVPLSWPEARRIIPLVTSCALIAVSELKFRDSLAAELPSAAQEIYQRAGLKFTKAYLFKPEEKGADEVAFKLSPLVLREIEPGQEIPAATNNPGALSLGATGLALDCGRPTIYWHADSVLLMGKVRPRLSYTWFFLSGNAKQVSAQGIRITLGNSGEPIIWEALNDPTGLKLVFVSQALEMLAVTNFGKPPSGRKYAIERGSDDAPKLVVARVLDDGPVPMGPIVYLRADGSIGTVICRCMPAQANELIGTTNYTLRPWSAVASAAEALRLSRPELKNLASWPGPAVGGEAPPLPLRLPPEF